MSATTIDVYVTSPPVVDVTIVSDPVFEVLGVLPTGPRGPAGEQGEQGIQGIQGIPGTDGTDGADGAPGADGEGVPTGGTVGQVLTKDSGTDFDTSWQDPDGGSGVVETIVAGSNIDVDATDPANPIVSVEALVDADIPASIARDSEVTAAVAAEAALARNADNLTSGTVADARIASTIARDSEVAAGYQPLDADLTALAAAGNSAVLAATTAPFLTADETKLDGIEAGAQVNPTSEAIQDIVGAMVSGGTETGIAVTYDDPNGRLDFVAEVTQTELDAVEDGLVSAIADGDSSTLTSAQSYADGKVSDTAYGAGWNADTTHAPSKNAVYDKIESLGGGSVDDTAYDATSWNGVTGTAPSKNAVRDKFELMAPLASPALTGSPTAPTQTAADNSTKIATTAYADAKVSDTAYNATSWDGVTGIAPSKNAVRDQVEALSATYAPKATPLPFKKVTDTSDRTITSTSLVVWPSVGTISLDLTVGQVVELTYSGRMYHSSAGGSTTPVAGFIIDQPTSADVNLERFSWDAGIFNHVVTGFFTATEAGTHIFKAAGKSGNGSSFALYGSVVTTHFWAKVLGTPTP